MGIKQNGLRIGIGDYSHTHPASKFGELVFKFCPEIGTFDIMDASPESFTGTVEYHAGTLGAKVGIIISAKENIGNAPVARDNPKESAHWNTGFG
jgi:hypothetical protein